MSSRTCMNTFGRCQAGLREEYENREYLQGLQHQTANDKHSCNWRIGCRHNHICNQIALCQHCPRCMQYCARICKQEHIFLADLCTRFYSVANGVMKKQLIQMQVNISYRRARGWNLLALVKRADASLSCLHGKRTRCSLLARVKRADAGPISAHFWMWWMWSLCNILSLDVSKHMARFLSSMGASRAIVLLYTCKGTTQTKVLNCVLCVP